MLRKKQQLELHQKEDCISNLYTVTGIALFGVIVLAVSLSCYILEHHKYRRKWKDYDGCGLA